MKGKVIDLQQIKNKNKDCTLSGVITEFINNDISWTSKIKGDSFCRKTLTGEYFYIPNGYIRRDEEIEVINKEGNKMYISNNALQPYPLLYDTIKVIVTTNEEMKHKIIPPCWNGEFFEATWEKVGLLTHKPGNKSKLVIAFDNGIFWQTNVKI